MVLSDTDLKLLHLLETSPTISVRELAHRAGISWITADRHLRELRENGVISDSVAVFGPSRLGLDRLSVLLKAGRESQVRQLESACDAHPYTHYRSRVYGPYAGLFAQFDIPHEGVAMLKRFLTELQDGGVCERVTYLRSMDYRRSTKTNPELFDPTTLSWTYSWDKWERDITAARTELPQGSPRRRLHELGLTRVDLSLLEELTKNASVSQSVLEKKYGLSQSTVSRKLIFLRENVIESVRAQIDRSRFDITSTKLFYSPRVPDDDRAKVYNAFSAPSAPPFPLSIDLLEGGGVILWGRMPPSYEHGLFYLLWSRLPEIQVFTMDTVGSHSRMYWFYPDNVDFERNTWKYDEDWMFKKPLSELQQGMA
ncbi:MAG: winged helix-turn-helix transcriptional regulator [Candidatus Thorarchaeota archaeon]|nr:winged helix-turn-helix transcriptional regulator [Candidatus Thorarchaeota archaeon]